MVPSSDIDLPPIRGIDPLHPLVDVFAGNVNELPSLADDGVLLYMFGGNREGTLYVGATRNPQARFARHRRDRWWPHVTQAVVYRIDCHWHESPTCSVEELDQAARTLEAWLADLFEPAHSHTLRPIS